MRSISALEKRRGRAVRAASPPRFDREFSRSHTRWFDGTACGGRLQGPCAIGPGLSVEAAWRLSLLWRWTMGAWVGDDLPAGARGAGLDSTVSLSWMHGRDSNAAVGVLAAVFLWDRDDSIRPGASIETRAMASRSGSSGGGALAAGLGPSGPSAAGIGGFFLSRGL
jgi:hypothetical protein